MILKEVLLAIQEIAPFQLQESYDNSGLQVGNPNSEVNSALVALDCTEEVLDEAISRSIDLIIVHHPLLFNGLKKLTEQTMVERILSKAIKNDISIVAIHTNLDNIELGVNHKICEVLGLENTRVLVPKRNTLRKLVFYSPSENAEAIRQAVFEVGGGEIGNYSNCSFNSNGLGTFKAGDAANPHLGKIGELHREEEQRVEVIFPYYLESAIIEELIRTHPYEEVAYDIYSLENSNQEIGSGMVGDLSASLSIQELLSLVKSKFGANGIRYTKSESKKVKKIAVCGGSGSFLLKDAINNGADVFISADFKYHQFFEAEGKIVIMDIGHYETEQFTSINIQELLQEKIPNFVTHLSGINTNPILYS